MNDTRRCEILGINGDYKYGGIEKFDGLDYDGLKTLMDEGFIKPDECQNCSPTTQEFHDFIEGHKEFTAHGYAVSPQRDDCRATVEGLAGYAASIDSLQDFIEAFHNADEFEVDVKTRQCYVWYD